HWPGSATPDGYECPEGFRTGDNPEGSLFCVYSGLNVPNTPTLRPYCDFLEDGILGYQWCLDPLAASCPQTPRPQPADDPVAPPTASGMETVTAPEEQTQDDQNATPQDEHPGDSNGDDDEVSPGEAAASQEQAGDPSPDEHPETDPETHDENEPSSDAVIVAPPEGTDSEPAVHEEPHSSLVEEMMEEEEEKPLPSPVSAEPPGDDEEDHRCESMCKRLDHCGGLERSAIPEVQSCVDLCHTWGYAFQNALFGCNLDQAETCQEVLTCWTPGG
ncbi:MAG: hypothetical protein VX938_02465, partial [Myxococcota bacterium]|nr:hypothetical protein [Myxococcota bacterium]